MFSTRLPARLETNAFSRAVVAARRSGVRLIDLTVSNPTDVGLSYPPDLMTSLAVPDALTYRPDPLGLPQAREAIASDLGVRSSQVVVTASTSEAYAFLFKLLCDPGDEVLVPVPGYPLFELLTGLEGVTRVPYRLDRTGGWCLDRAGLEGALSTRTKAVLVVSPNNPTGSVLDPLDRQWLVGLVARRRIALVADEVFGDYLHHGRRPTASLLGEDRALVFTLGGLSKSAGLPQVKLGWMVVSGPEPIVAEALDRLMLIADTYLSVGTPVQLAAPRLIAAGRQVRDQIARRLAVNLDAIDRAAAASPALTLVEPAGGWSAVLRIPAVESEERLVLRLLDEAQLVVHPGYFFDFDAEAFLVVSLLPEPDVFAAGLDRLSRTIAGVCR